MNFGERSEIKSFQKMVQFLESERFGRFATIDKNGFPFIAPMNFVFFNSCFYVHGFPKGEKYEDIKTNAKCGFEVDEELAFLPSYFFERLTPEMATVKGVGLIKIKPEVMTATNLI
jgi:nitroimidazol reductase NimA-like FMN-containing flavoprotein (pyridoxamine 5'-phosphate oxidase superfamily)